MRIPILSNLLRKEPTALVPVKPAEPQEQPSQRSEQASRQQLLDLFSEATQNPPPGPGGVLGISEPWDIPAPFETPQEYASRHRKGPNKNFEGAQHSQHQAEQGRRRGDQSYARLREEDTKDKLQSPVAPGDRYTWLILAGSCLIFLLLALFIIILPHGQQSSQPNIWIY